jgi:hypothetical protein
METQASDFITQSFEKLDRLFTIDVYRFDIAKQLADLRLKRLELQLFTQFRIREYPVHFESSLQQIEKWNLQIIEMAYQFDSTYNFLKNTIENGADTRMKIGELHDLTQALLHILRLQNHLITSSLSYLQVMDDTRAILKK